MVPFVQTFIPNRHFSVFSKSTNNLEMEVSIVLIEDQDRVFRSVKLALNVTIVLASLVWIGPTRGVCAPTWLPLRVNLHG